ncbi:glycogen debranching N-terminal domain-containing protein, partial [Arthrobacter crystallopoietes]|uniref:glycogen debranching N-terminal domain-containing protein n=1 Tax=Crystallibacter crystallopoietes TaxID=37928 RepID=UPI003D236635
EGILEDIIVRNYNVEPARCVMALSVGTDFADLFEVKEGRAQRQGEQTRHSGGGKVSIEGVWQGIRKGVVVRAPDADVGPEGLLFRVLTPAHGEWAVQVAVVPVVDDREACPPLEHSPDTAAGPAAAGLVRHDPCNPLGQSVHPADHPAHP